MKNNIIRIEIPNYIRQVRISEEQQPVYYEFKKNIIKAKNKLLPDKFIDRTKQKLIESQATQPQDLKSDYKIGIFRGDKLQGILTDTTLFGEYSETITWYIRDSELPKGSLKKPQKYLLMTNEGEKIIANPKKVGNPNIITIRGQDIYSGNVRDFLRGKIMQEIKESFLPYVKDLDIIDASLYPLRFKCYLFDCVNNVVGGKVTEQRWDVGNRIYPYSKAFLDLLSTGKSGVKDGEGNPIIYFSPKIKDDDRLHVTEDPQGGIFCPVDDVSESKLVFIIGKDDKYFNGQLRSIEKERRLLIEKSKHYGGRTI